MIEFGEKVEYGKMPSVFAYGRWLLFRWEIEEKEDLQEILINSIF